MTAARQPRLKGRAQARVTPETIATLRGVIPQSWWRRLLARC
jgi:hypothetical protein